MQGTLKLPPEFAWRAPHAGQPIFRAWLCAPLTLKQGDEIEVDVPLDESGAIRVFGRVVAVAVHVDGRLWYQFAAERTATIDSEPR